MNEHYSRAEFSNVSTYVCMLMCITLISCTLNFRYIYMYIPLKVFIEPTNECLLASFTCNHNIARWSKETINKTVEEAINLHTVRLPPIRPQFNTYDNNSTYKTTIKTQTRANILLQCCEYEQVGCYSNT